jgi:hypothetical protein
MRNLAMVGLLAIFPILGASAADQAVSFSGTWMLNEKKSDPFPHQVIFAGSGLDMSGGDISGDRSSMGGAGTLSSRDMGGGMPGGRGMQMPGGMGAQAPVKISPLVIQQSETEMEISRITNANGKEIPIIDKYKTDGSENVSMVQVPNSPDPVKVVTRATLNKNKFVVIMASSTSQGKNEVKREYSLSKDGKTLTLNTTNTGPKGQLVQKQVYQKQ